MATITTHVLNTALGKPAQALAIVLYQKKAGKWNLLAAGSTNKDGRIPNLIAKEKELEQGTYKMQFQTQNYFNQLETPCFYPQVEVEFTVYDDSHYHIPLLISPFGYSTYRGS